MEPAPSDNRTGTVIGPSCHRNEFEDLRRRDGLWWHTCDETDTPREFPRCREAGAGKYRLTRGTSSDPPASSSYSQQPLQRRQPPCTTSTIRLPTPHRP